MPKGHRGACGAATRYIEPGHEALRCGACGFFGVKFHHAFCRAKTQSRQGVDHGTPAVMTCPGVTPMIWRVAIKGLHEVGHCGAAQHISHFASQLQGLQQGPGGQHARMDHENVMRMYGHFLLH